jgi:hypothetical protein
MISPNLSQFETSKCEILVGCCLNPIRPGVAHARKPEASNSLHRLIISMPRLVPISLRRSRSHFHSSTPSPNPQLPANNNLRLSPDSQWILRPTKIRRQRRTARSLRPQQAVVAPPPSRLPLDLPLHSPPTTFHTQARIHGNRYKMLLQRGLALISRMPRLGEDGWMSSPRASL